MVDPWRECQAGVKVARTFFTIMNLQLNQHFYKNRQLQKLQEWWHDNNAHLTTSVPAGSQAGRVTWCRVGGGGRFVAQVDPLSSKHYFVSHFQLIYKCLPLFSCNLCVIAHHCDHPHPHHYHHRSNAGYGPISRGVLAMPFVPIVDGEFLPTGHRIPVQMKISWDG